MQSGWQNRLFQPFLVVYHQLNHFLAHKGAGGTAGAWAQIRWFSWNPKTEKGKQKKRTS